jgi:hypothetical protein
MWFIAIMKTRTARTVKVIIGALLFVYGSVQYSLAGLLMMMAGIVLVVTALAGICLVEEALAGWRTRHGAPPLPRHP